MDHKIKVITAPLNFVMCVQERSSQRKIKRMLILKYFKKMIIIPLNWFGSENVWAYCLKNPTKIILHSFLQRSVTFDNTINRQKECNEWNGTFDAKKKLE